MHQLAINDRAEERVFFISTLPQNSRHDSILCQLFLYNKFYNTQEIPVDMESTNNNAGAELNQNGKSCGVSTTKLAENPKTALNSTEKVTAV